jgi:uncharacterized protein YkwD
VNRAATPTETDLRLAGEMFSLVNDVRLARSMPLFAPILPIYRYLTGLDAVAQGHCHSMIDNAWYGHADLDGKKVGDRLYAAGFRLRYHQENVGYIAPHSAGKAFETFMASSGHRANILNPAFTFLGIGTAVFLELQKVRNTRDNVDTTLGPAGRLWSMVFYSPPAV